MNFVAIDFETATSAPNSICSMGICSVEDNLIVDVSEILIKPEPFEFNEYNVAIHQITPEQVFNKPRLCDIWDKIYPILQNKIIVAHNASFDVGALRAALDCFGIEYPSFKYICTVKLSQKAYPELSSHKLNAMAEALGIEFNHHHAGEDAYVCARILIKIMEDFNLKTLEDIERKFEIGIGEIFPGYYTPCTKSKKSKSHKKICTKNTEQKK